MAKYAFKAYVEENGIQKTKYLAIELLDVSLHDELSEECVVVLSDEQVRSASIQAARRVREKVGCALKGLKAVPVGTVWIEKDSDPAFVVGKDCRW